MKYILSSGFSRYFPWLACCFLSLALTNRAGAAINNTRKTTFSVYRSTGFQRADCGNNFTVEIRGGALWAWGNNASGQLGTGNTLSQSTPVQIGADTRWVHVSTGNSHTIAIKSDGTLWAWGSNSNGQLGIGNTVSQLSPVQVGTDTKWASISAGAFYTVAIKADGTLWAWGDNTYGQLGNGNTTQANSPIEASTDTKWVTVAAGTATTLAIRAHGNLWGWGRNNTYLLGIGNTTDQHSPVQIGQENTWIDLSIGANNALGIKTNGSLWMWGGTATIPSAMPGADWVVCAAGEYHGLAIKSNGTLWSWGVNYTGQLGNGNTTTQAAPVQVGADNKWVNLAAGYDHSLAYKADGTLWTWGSNGSGQLGNGATTMQSIPVFVDSLSDRWMTIATGIGDSSLLAYNGRGQSLSLRSDGTIWRWGANNTGQLGLGFTSLHSSMVPGATDHNWIYVATGSGHSMAIKSDGTLWAWGSNNLGQLGIGSYTDQSTPVQVGSDNNWVAVSVANTHTAALKSDGSLWLWGDNTYGQLGFGNNISYNFPVSQADNQWTGVSVADGATYAIEADGTISACGLNTNGQLGFSNTNNQSLLSQVGADTRWVSVSGGAKQALGLKSDGTLWAWGNNASGQLGFGNTTNQSTPKQVGTDTRWVSVAPGYNFTLALKNNGTLWAWGNNGDGALGLGNYTSVTGPTQVTSQSAVVQLADGMASAHSAIIKVSRDAVCEAGANASRQLGGNTGPSNNSNVFNCLYLVKPAITITSNAADTVCPGTAITFSVASTSNAGIQPSYHWLVNGLPVGADTTIYTSSTLHTGDTVVCLIQSDALGAYPDTVRSNKIRVNLFPVVFPSITITASSTLICNGTIVIFTAHPVNAGNNPGYQWRLNGVNVGTNTDTLAVASLQNGDTVTCTLTGQYPCGTLIALTSNVISVQINPVPSVTIVASQHDLCPADIDSFRAIGINGGSAPQYQWFRNSVPVFGSTDTVYRASGFNNGDIISVRLISNAACATPPTVYSNQIPLTVQSQITSGINVNSIPPNTLCHGALITFVTNIAGGGANPRYQWQKNGVSIPGATAPTYADYGLLNGDTITCLLTSSEHCVVANPLLSNKVGLTVLPSLTPSAVISSSTGTNLTKGVSVTFTAAVTNGGPVPAYQWMKNGATIPGATNSTYTTNTLSDGDVISLKLQSTAPCASPPIVSSNQLLMRDEATGVSAIAGAENVSLYPNPTTGSLVLDCSSTVSFKDAVRIEIINAIGQAVYSKMLAPFGVHFTLPITLSSALSNGIYLLRISGGELSATKSFRLSR